jgi:wyosine [tRNA(Phe)-imidazoG37] synthetase (radical SAM superfamily)
METFLFEELIIGPVNSRRLGVSLGINLLPLDAKLCNFDCVYCECGWTKNDQHKGIVFPENHEVVNALIEKIKSLSEGEKMIDSITFAGNGEPTLHPQFLEIIRDVVLVRDLMLPNTKISVLTNATALHKPDVMEALMMVDKRILKLDAGTNESLQKINKPLGGYTIEKIKHQLKKFRGDLSIQALFFKGVVDGEIIDNTSQAELKAWKEHIIDLNPKEVMLYSLDRNTPEDNLTAISQLELSKIAAELKPYHIKTLVA